MPYAGLGRRPPERAGPRAVAGPAAGKVHDDVHTGQRRSDAGAGVELPDHVVDAVGGLAVLPGQHAHRRPGRPEAGDDEAAERAGAAGDENGCGHGVPPVVTSARVRGSTAMTPADGEA